MVEEVEYGEAAAHMELPVAEVNGEGPGHLQIRGREPREPLGVARSQILAIVILY